MGIRKSSTQITDRLDLEDLPGRQVAPWATFPPRQIGTFMPEVLALGFADEIGAVVLLSPDRLAPNGSRLI